MILLQPQAAAHALKAAVGAAKATGSIGTNGQVADLAGVRIRAVMDAAVEDDATADTCRKSHVEERIEADARAIVGLAQPTHIRIVVHDSGDTQFRLDEIRQVKVFPAAHVRRECDCLSLKIDRPAKADAAAGKGHAFLPFLGDRDDLFQHPITTTLFVCSSRFAQDHLIVIESRQSEFSPTDIDGQSVHGNSSSLF